MTKEEAFEWATVNAGKKYWLKNCAVGDQEVVVIGSYAFDGQVAVELSNGRGWDSCSGVFPNIRWTVAIWNPKRTYQFVPKEDLAPIEKRLSAVEAFEPGDVVYLKSGGPAMTVDQPADEDGEYLCRWFPMERWQGETSEDYFPPGTLTKTRPTTIS